MVKKKYNSIEECLSDYEVNETGCFIFKGAKSRGYGVASINNVRYLTHRLSYEYFKNKISKDMFICHSCNEPSCINPTHLYEGTHQDNCNDRKKDFRDKISSESIQSIDKDFNKNEIIRTTIILPKQLHITTKQFCLLTGSSMSKFVRVALREEIDRLKGKKN